jgi:hypothetical protein
MAMRDVMEETAVDTSVLSSMTLQGDSLTLVLPHSEVCLGMITESNRDEIIAAITAKLESGKRPSATLSNCLNQIGTHQRLLLSATVKLMNSYAKMQGEHTAPVKRAQLKLFTHMSDKMMKEYASGIIGDEIREYILPDDRDKLIERILVKVSTVSESEDTEE